MDNTFENSPSIHKKPLEVFYIQDLEGVFHRCERTLKRYQHAGVLPKPDGKDATGHPWWRVETIIEAQKDFLGVAA